MVKLAVSNQTLIVTASSDISGNAYEELEVEQTGEDLTIAFNARYLVEILNHVKSAQTVIEFLGPLSPAAIRPLDPPKARSSSTCSCRCGSNACHPERSERSERSRGTATERGAAFLRRLVRSMWLGGLILYRPST